jgi:uncharacterized protein YecE (DUF72 family)
VGCGSWTDDAYVGVLYPEDLPKTERLRTYADWFDRIEVNATYHAFPAIKHIAAWAQRTPPRFMFDFKLPEIFSRDPAQAAKDVPRFLAAMQPMVDAGKLGVFLLTLAPSFAPGRNRLGELDAVAEKLAPHRLAVELRHRGWVDGEALAATLDYFRRRLLAWVALDLPRLNHPAILPPLDEVTDPRLAYVRLHGRNPAYLQAKDAAGRHHYEYTATDLAAIVARVRALAAQAQDVHVSVNNHAADFAPKAALALRRLLGQHVPDTMPGSLF